MKLVRVLHERMSGRSRTSLALFECEDGSHVYGVVQDGEILMTGTKAEAKAAYGNWRKL